MPPNASYGRRQWKALVGSPSHRQSVASTIPHLRPQNRGPSRQTPRLDFPDQFQRRLSQAAA
jgi:hypothetical protein